MSKTGYAIVPVNMELFLQGQNPTESDLYERKFYDSMEYAAQMLQDNFRQYTRNHRLGPAACIVQMEFKDDAFSTDSAVNGATLRREQHVLGYAELQAGQVTDAVILWKVNRMGKQVCLSAEAGNWEAARQEGWVVREEQFKKQCLSWGVNGELSQFAQHVLNNYMDACMDVQDAQEIDIHTGMSLDGIIELAAHEAVKYPFPSEMDRVAGMLSAAHAAALKFANEHQMPEFTAALQEHCSDFQKFIEPEAQFRINTMVNMRSVAAAHLAFLPEDMMHEATEMFNNEIWRAYREKPEFTWNLGQYTFSALAVTLDKLSARMDGELLAETAQHWKQCSDEAISRGATREDTCYRSDDQRDDIPGNEEQDNEEP